MIKRARTRSKMLLSQAEEKVSLRKRLAEKRKSLSDAEKTERSERLCKNLCSLDEFRKADVVMSFWPLPNETDVRLLNTEALRLGKTLVLPRCVKGTREMNFYVVNSFDDLEKGYFSIYEPKAECPLFVPSDSLRTVCIVPAMAYDKEGYRIGYGGGFYDTYLSRYKIYTVGAVYHDFIVEKLPRDEYDSKVDTVVTDEGTVDM